MLSYSSVCFAATSSSLEKELPTFKRICNPLVNQIVRIANHKWLKDFKQLIIKQLLACFNNFYYLYGVKKY